MKSNKTLNIAYSSYRNLKPNKENIKQGVEQAKKFATILKNLNS